MDPADFVRKHPRLFHLAHADGWEGIRAHGLLSSRELVTRAGVDSGETKQLLAERRPEPVRLDVAGVGTAVLRDHKPLHPGKLSAALTDGMTVDAWLEHLNSLVFLFPDDTSLLKLYEVYKAEPAVVLTLDTRRLVNAYGARLRVSAINSGSVLYKAQPRGRGTFKGLAQHDATKPVREVAVMDPITDLATYLLGAELWLPDGSREPLALS